MATQNNTLKRLAGALVFSALISVAMMQTVFAYSYTFVNKSGQTITKIYIHTVSGLCKNKTWTGSFSASDGTLSVSPQAACLVDGVEAWDSAGKHYSEDWQLGIAGTTFTVNSDGTINH